MTPHNKTFEQRRKHSFKMGRLDKQSIRLDKQSIKRCSNCVFIHQLPMAYRTPLDDLPITTSDRGSAPPVNTKALPHVSPVIYTKIHTTLLNETDKDIFDIFKKVFYASILEGYKTPHSKWNKGIPFYFDKLSKKKLFNTDINFTEIGELLINEFERNAHFFEYAVLYYKLKYCEERRLLSTSDSRKKFKTRIKSVGPLQIMGQYLTRWINFTWCKIMKQISKKGSSNDINFSRAIRHGQLETCITLFACNRRDDNVMKSIVDWATPVLVTINNQ